MHTISRRQGGLIPALAFLFIGCGVEIKQDTYLSDFDANVPSLELFIDGASEGHFIGQAVVDLPWGSELTSINIRALGYFNGTIKAYSPDCDIPTFKTRYVNSELVRIPIEGKLQSKCTIVALMQPELPNEYNNKVVVHGLFGVLRIRGVKPGYSAQGMSFRSISGAQIHFPLLGIRDIPNQPLYVRGCGVSKDLTANKDTVSFNSDEIGMDVETPRLCVIETAAPQSNIIQTYMIAIYSKAYQFLARPKLWWEGNTLKYNAERSVSIVVLDGHRYRYSDHEEFSDTNPNESHDIRLITTNRILYGAYSPPSGWLFYDGF